MTKEILVIGGTGATGSLLVKLLQENNADYRALVRSEKNEELLASQGIPTVRGALGDWPTVEAALTGIDTIFLLTSPAPNMLELQQGLIDRARIAGVRKIVRMSAQPAQDGCDMALYDLHGKADEYLKQSGLEYVILRPHYFMQNIESMHAGFIKENNMFAQYLGDAQIPMVDVRDIAKAAYFCLKSDAFNNKVHVITGPRAISFADVAISLSKTHQRNIRYTDISFEEQEAGLKAFGVPDWTVNTVMTLFRQWVETGRHEVSPDFENITKTKATDIDQYVADYAASF